MNNMETMATKKKETKKTGRAKPMTPKAGVTKDRGRRYGCGGKVKK